MTTTPVGMRCPECARERTTVRAGAGALAAAAVPYATYALIGLNAIVFLAELMAGGGAATSARGGAELMVDGGLCGNAVGDGGVCAVGRTGVVSDGGEVFRLVTGGFLHAGVFHLLLNMFALYILGSILEPAIGTARFLGIYFAALLAGSFGALLLSDPNQVTVGASGAVFGLMGAGFVIARHRGLDQVASQIGLFVVLNLIFTFSVPGISIGGHLGGLIGGGLLALLLSYVERGFSGGTARAIEAAGIGLVVVGSVAGALAVAGGASA